MGNRYAPHLRVVQVPARIRIPALGVITGHQLRECDEREVKITCAHLIKRNNRTAPMRKPHSFPLRAALSGKGALAVGAGQYHQSSTADRRR